MNKEILINNRISNTIKLLYSKKLNGKKLDYEKDGINFLIECFHNEKFFKQYYGQCYLTNKQFHLIWDCLEYIDPNIIKELFKDELKKVI